VRRPHRPGCFVGGPAALSPSGLAQISSFSLTQSHKIHPNSRPPYTHTITFLRRYGSRTPPHHPSSRTTTTHTQAGAAVPEEPTCCQLPPRWRRAARDRNPGTQSRQAGPIQQLTTTVSLGAGSVRTATPPPAPATASNPTPRRTRRGIKAIKLDG
jgi:hypothetical protein